MAGSQSATRGKRTARTEGGSGANKRPAPPNDGRPIGPRGRMDESSPGSGRCPEARQIESLRLVTVRDSPRGGGENRRVQKAPSADAGPLSRDSGREGSG